MTPTTKATADQSHAGATDEQVERVLSRLRNHARADQNYTNATDRRDAADLIERLAAMPTPAPYGDSGELRSAVEHLLDVGEFCRTDDTESALRRLTAALAALSAPVEPKAIPDDGERGAVVAWLRADADLTEVEARKIFSDSHGLTLRDAADWQNLVATKRGIADAIERGIHLSSDAGER